MTERQPLLTSVRSQEIAFSLAFQPVENQRMLLALFPSALTNDAGESRNQVALGGSLWVRGELIGRVVQNEHLGLKAATVRGWHRSSHPRAPKCR